MDHSTRVLEHVFKHYSSIGRRPGAGIASLDGAQFARLCREIPGLFDANLSPAEADLVFKQAKPQGNDTVDFSHFLEALMLLSWKKYPETDVGVAFNRILVRHKRAFTFFVQFH